MIRFLKILFIFTFGFIIFSTAASASELEDPVAESSSPESEESHSYDTEPVVESSDSFDFTLMEQSINNLNDNFSSVLPVFSSLPITDFYKDYFRGIIYNLPWSTQYLLFTDLDPNGIEHYYFVYNLQFDDSGTLILGSYPCLDVYLVGEDIVQDNITKELTAIPSIGFGSFFPYSNLVNRSFPVNYLIVGIIVLAAWFIFSRKAVYK